MNFRQLFYKYRLPFFSSLSFGLLAFGFCMLNKIPVGDDLVGLFDKGPPRSRAATGWSFCAL